jgi:hypothetical protein
MGSRSESDCDYCHRNHHRLITAAVNLKVSDFVFWRVSVTLSRDCEAEGCKHVVVFIAFEVFGCGEYEHYTVLECDAV